MVMVLLRATTCYLWVEPCREHSRKLVQSMQLSMKQNVRVNGSGHM